MAKANGTRGLIAVDIPARRWKSSFAAGKGCESLGFF
jgi:hypothetical protein